LFYGFRPTGDVIRTITLDNNPYRIELFLLYCNYSDSVNTGVTKMSDVIVQVQKRMLISLAQIAKELNIQEGDHMVIEEKDGGIFLRPVAWHDKNQDYFWTKEWQEKVKRSLEALEKGEYKKFYTMDELFKELDGDEENANDNSNRSV
jgi:hypothetical protein